MKPSLANLLPTGPRGAPEEPRSLLDRNARNAQICTPPRRVADLPTTQPPNPTDQPVQIQPEFQFPSSPPPPYAFPWPAPNVATSPLKRAPTRRETVSGKESIRLGRLAPGQASSPISTTAFPTAYKRAPVLAPFPSRSGLLLCFPGASPRLVAFSFVLSFCFPPRFDSSKLFLARGFDLIWVVAFAFLCSQVSEF